MNDLNRLLSVKPNIVTYYCTKLIEDLEGKFRAELKPLSKEVVIGLKETFSCCDGFSLPTAVLMSYFSTQRWARRTSELFDPKGYKKHPLAQAFETYLHSAKTEHWTRLLIGTHLIEDPIQFLIDEVGLTEHQMVELQMEYSEANNV